MSPTNTPKSFVTETLHAFADGARWFAEQVDDLHKPPDEPAETHDYRSTACHHGFHALCRLDCKYCDAPCDCDCHD